MVDIYYSKLQLGMKLNVCIRTIDNWIASGKISYSKLGKRVIFSQKDLDEFIERNHKGIFDEKKAETLINSFHKR